MKALVLKDLRVLRPWWWLIVPGHMLFGANGIVAPQSFFTPKAWSPKPIWPMLLSRVNGKTLPQQR